MELSRLLTVNPNFPRKTKKANWKGINMTEISKLFNLSREHNWFLKYFYEHQFRTVPLSQVKKFVDKMKSDLDKYITAKEDLIEIGLINAYSDQLMFLGEEKFCSTSYVHRYYHTTHLGKLYIKSKFPDAKTDVEFLPALQNHKANVFSKEEFRKMDVEEARFYEIFGGWGVAPKLLMEIRNEPNRTAPAQD